MKCKIKSRELLRLLAASNHPRKRQRLVSMDEKADDLLKRFWRKVKKTKTCWIWQGGTDLSRSGKNGYGKLKIAGKGFQATKILWWIERGAISKTKQICHTCDNPPCVNPAHLWLGTAKQNVRDCIQKGRRRKFRPLYKKEVTNYWSILYRRKRLKRMLGESVQEFILQNPSKFVEGQSGKKA